MEEMIKFADMKLSKTRSSLYGNLRTVKMRRRHSLFTVEGEKGVTDTLNHYSLEALLLTPEANLPENVLKSAREVYEVEPSEMKALSSFTTPSAVMGIFRIPEHSDLEPINEDELYVMLDGVRDPGNLGTIIRTCHWFGIRRIFASYDSVDCYNPKAVQSAMGSLGAVRVEYTDLVEIIREHRGMPVYGTLLEGEDVFNAPLGNNGFIVMGNEGKGLSEELRKALTVALNIPPATDNHGESLNVAVATAIVLAQFESAHRRSGRR